MYFLKSQKKTVIVFYLAILILLIPLSRVKTLASKKNSDNLPKTVSEKAQEFLRTVKPFTVRPNSPEAWKKAQAAFNEGNRSYSDKIREELVERTEKTTIASTPVLIVTPKNYNKKNDGQVIVFIHGGAYVVGDPETYHMVQAPIAYEAGLKLYSINYGLAPERPFPGGLDDCLAVYRELLKTFKAKNIVFSGDSAGGGLALATLLKAREEGLPMPRAVALLSPWSDLSKTGDTYYTLEGRDPILDYDKNLEVPAKLYAGTHPFTDPLVSPVYADYTKGFPRTLITTGTRDLFLSNCARLYRKMKRGGVDVQIDIWEGMWHVFQDYTTPEARESAKNIGRFLKPS